MTDTNEPIFETEDQRLKWLCCVHTQFDERRATWAFEWIKATPPPAPPQAWVQPPVSYTGTFEDMPEKASLLAEDDPPPDDDPEVIGRVSFDGFMRREGAIKYNFRTADKNLQPPKGALVEVLFQSGAVRVGRDDIWNAELDEDGYIIAYRVLAPDIPPLDEATTASAPAPEFDPPYDNPTVYADEDSDRAWAAAQELTSEQGDAAEQGIEEGAESVLTDSDIADKTVELREKLAERELEEV